MQLKKNEIPWKGRRPPAADGGARAGVDITQRFPVISILIRPDDSRGIISITVMLRPSLKETPCDLAKTEDNHAYGCAAMLVYMWQLKDKMRCLISCWPIKESNTGLKKPFASHYSQIPEILSGCVSSL